MTEETRIKKTHQMQVYKGVPRAWDGRIAYVITNIASPPVLGLFVLVLASSTLASLAAWTWTGVYVVIAVLAPLAFLVSLMHRGAVTDLDVQLREQRVKPLIFSLVCGGLAWLILRVGRAPRLIVLLTGLSWVQMTAAFLITLRWKISMHCATAAGVATAIWSFIGTPLPLLIGVPIIAWTRVRLRRHTLTQTIAGSLLGASVFTMAFVLPIGG